ncbi:CHASE2 domain-containing protein [Azotobacter chroococcum]|uniref:CHASE2 domain-containing protein n=1 Tax=Azotobacter chroococcum TaxID=353 RepID=UPI0010386B51|nr:CHASE2 domain-containing protein [Azotobacter chroococcum]TBW01772.1 CHASE2 domain-containing protein [Azotobacter chroococcum]
MDTSSSKEEPSKGLISKILAKFLRAYRKPTVFISYRRADTLVYAEKIHERLEAELGKWRVFFDKKDIDLGVDFAKIIEARIASCQVLLVLVGPDWLCPPDPDKDGVRRRRLDDPNDYVRFEIEAGLRRGEACKVIPVLVHGGKMPEKKDIPPTMAKFCDRAFPKPIESVEDESFESLIWDILNIKPNIPQVLRTEQFRRSVIPLILCAVLAALTAGWVNLLDLFRLDAASTNVTMRLANSLAKTSPSDRVVLVGINKDTVNWFRKPFDKTWRREHAILIHTLAKWGASAVVFDMFLDEPSAYDSELSSAVSWAQSKGTAVIFGTKQWPSVIPDLEAAGVEFGFICIGGKKSFFGSAPLAALAVMRKLQNEKQDQEIYIPSITLMAFVSGAQIKYIDFDGRRIDFRDKKITEDSLKEFKSIRFSTQQRNSPSHQNCPPLTDGDMVAQSMIRLSALELLRSPTKRRKYEDFFNDSATHVSKDYANKIVLVGKEASGDQFNIFGENRYGFEIHADILHALVGEINIHPLDFRSQLLVALLMAYQGQRAILSKAFKRKLIRILYLVMVAICYFAISILLYAKVEVLLDTYPLFAFFAAYKLMVWRARRLKIEIWNAR